MHCECALLIHLCSKRTKTVQAGSCRRQSAAIDADNSRIEMTLERVVCSASAAATSEATTLLVFSVMLVLPELPAHASPHSPAVNAAKNSTHSSKPDVRGAMTAAQLPEWVCDSMPCQTAPDTVAVGSHAGEGGSRKPSPTRVPTHHRRDSSETLRRLSNARDLLLSNIAAAPPLRYTDQSASVDFPMQQQQQNKKMQPHTVPWTPVTPYTCNRVLRPPPLAPTATPFSTAVAASIHAAATVEPCCTHTSQLAAAVAAASALVDEAGEVQDECSAVLAVFQQAARTHDARASVDGRPDLESLSRHVSVLQGECDALRLERDAVRGERDALGAECASLSEELDAERLRVAARVGGSEIGRGVDSEIARNLARERELRQVDEGTRRQDRVGEEAQRVRESERESERETGAARDTAKIDGLLSEVSVLQEQLRVLQQQQCETQQEACVLQQQLTTSQEHAAQSEERAHALQYQLSTGLQRAVAAEVAAAAAGRHFFKVCSQLHLLHTTTIQLTFRSFSSCFGG